MWFGALLAMVALPCLLAWTLKGNISKRPVSFAIRLKAILTPLCNFDLDIQFRVPPSRQCKPAGTDQVTPPPSGLPDGTPPDDASAEGGDEP